MPDGDAMTGSRCGAEGPKIRIVICSHPRTRASARARIVRRRRMTSISSSTSSRAPNLTGRIASVERCNATTISCCRRRAFSDRRGRSAMRSSATNNPASGMTSTIARSRLGTAMGASSTAYTYTRDTLTLPGRSGSPTARCATRARVARRRLDPVGCAEQRRQTQVYEVDVGQSQDDVGVQDDSFVQQAVDDVEQ